MRNPGDLATRLSARGLVEPLARSLREEHRDWEVEERTDGDTRKESLRGILCDDDLPALVFTASHGLGVGYDDCTPGSDQGALVCGDWPGPTATRWAR